MERNQKWCVLHYGGSDSLVTFREEDPENLYWWGGPSYCNFEPSEETYVIHEYGVFSDMDDQGIEAVELHFLKNYNVPEEIIIQDSGWLAPDGKFFPCEWQQHRNYAYRLAAIYYDALDRDLLEKKGWIKVLVSGDAIQGHDENWDPYFPATQEQIDTLVKILNSPPNPDPDFTDNLRRGMVRLARQLEETRSL